MSITPAANLFVDTSGWADPRHTDGLPAALHVILEIDPAELWEDRRHVPFPPFVVTHDSLAAGDETCRDDKRVGGGNTAEGPDVRRLRRDGEVLTTAHEALGAQAFDRAWAQGTALSLEQAITEAMKQRP